MKFKWYYAFLPACVSFGPFFMSNMGGLSDHGWVMPLMGTVMVTAAMSGMLKVIAEQRIALSELLEERKHSASPE